MPYIDHASDAHKGFQNSAHAFPGMSNATPDQLTSLFNSPWGQYIIDAERESSGYNRQALAQQREISMAEIGQRAAASRAQAGAARYASDNQLRAAKMEHQWRMDRLRELEIPQMEINRMDVEGRLRIAEMTQRLNEQSLAADVVETAARMGGPGEWVQAWNYARGISQTEIPEYLNLLTSGGSTYNLGGGVGTPTPQSYGGLIESLSGGAGSVGQSALPGGGQTVGGRNWGQINSMADTLIRNPGQIALGGLEGLSQDEISGLGSLIRARGGSPDTFLEQYKRSRFGASNSALAAA